MKKDKKETAQRGRLIPEGELKCVWMMAGFVSFKLCNYQYECEKCPFDQVMRKSNDFIIRNQNIGDNLNLRTTSKKKPSRVNRPSSLAGIDFDKFFQKYYDIKIKRGLFYHRGHTWVDIKRPDCAKIGLDDFAGKLILGIKIVILPTLKNKIDQGQVFCWIVQEDGTLPILAPLTGSVLALNSKISNEPALVNRNPYERGWLMKIKPKSLDRDKKNLYTEDRIRALYKVDIEKLKGTFRSHLTKNWEQLGPTLCNGGNTLIHVRDMIGPKRYFDIISHFFTNK